MDGVQGPEPEFVGAARHALVEGLLAVYDEVAAAPTPRWVSLEAPSGWGKTRLARELYARLAAERQGEPAYWPPSLLSGADLDPNDVSTRRKRVNPTVAHVPGSLPRFAWWGISCTSRHGVASAAIAEDIGVLEAHSQYLEDAWLRLPRTSKAAADARALLGVVADEALMELGGRAVESALGAAVPGLGIVRWVAEWGWGKHREHSARVDRLESGGAIGADRSGVADAVVEMLVRLARPGLPAVLFVEDLHEADALLAEVLLRVVTADASVLVLSTGWPGHLEESEPLLAAMAAAGERLVRVTSEHPGPLPAPFPAAARLEPLSAQSLASVLRFYHPLVEDRTAELLVRRYPNPLALELFCQIPRYRRRYRDRPLSLTAAQVEELPSSIRDLYRTLWEELPESVREALAIATLGIPSVVDPTSGRSQLWNVDLMADAVEALGLPDHDDVDDAFEEAPTAYAWARVVTETLRRFVEPDQLRIASDDLAMFLDDSEVEAVRRTVTARLGRLFAEGSDPPPDEAEHGARLLLALHAEGFGVEPDLVARATLVLLDLLLDEPGELDERLRLADAAVAAGPSTGPRLEVELARVRVLSDLEHADRALAEVRRIGPDVLSHYGPASRQAVAAEVELAWLERDVDPRAALDRVVAVIETATAALGPTDRLTLSARTVHIGCLQRMSRLTECVEACRALLEDQRKALGERDADTMTSAHNLASSLRLAGRFAEARTAAESALARRLEVFGPTHGATLGSRSELARLHAETGDVSTSLTMRHELYDDTREFLGERHPSTLWAMDELCGGLTAVGRLTEALSLSAQQVALVADRFGADSPRSRQVRSWHATRLAATGRRTEAMDLVLAVATETATAYGVHDRRTVMAGLTASEVLRTCGRAQDAVTVAEELVALCRADDPAEFLLLASARAGLGRAYVDAGRLEESVPVLEQALAAGAEHAPDDVNSSAWVARTVALAYHATGRSEEALALVASWLVRCRDLMGPRAEVVVGLQVQRCVILGGVDPDRACAELIALDASLVGAYPPVHDQRIHLRQQLGVARREAGDLHESARVLGRLVLDLAEALGPAHPATLDAASTLFTTMGVLVDLADEDEELRALGARVVDLLCAALPQARDQLGRGSWAYGALLLDLSRVGGDRWATMQEFHEDAAEALVADPPSDPLQRAAVLGSLGVSRLHAEDPQGSLEVLCTEPWRTCPSGPSRSPRSGGTPSPPACTRCWRSSTGWPSATPSPPSSTA